MSANIEQIKAMLERTGKTNKQKVDLDKERLQLEATVNIEVQTIVDVLFENTTAEQLPLEKCFELAEKIVEKFRK